MLTAVLAFAVLAAVVTVTPGLDTMLVLRTTAVSGRASGLAAVTGVVLGCLVWALAGALGLTAVLTASRLAYDVLRLAGAVYLCWLGGRALWQARRPAPEPSQAAAAPPSRADPTEPRWPAPPAAAFRTGLTTNLVNPKVGVFYLTVMPQFLPDGVPVLLGSFVLGVTHMVEGVLWLSALVLAVGRARGWLTRPRVKRRLDQLCGAVFVGFGLGLAFDRGLR